MSRARPGLEFPLADLVRAVSTYLAACPTPACPTAPDCRACQILRPQHTRAVRTLARYQAGSLPSRPTRPQENRDGNSHP